MTKTKQRSFLPSPVTQKRETKRFPARCEATQSKRTSSSSQHPSYESKAASKACPDILLKRVKNFPFHTRGRTLVLIRWSRPCIYSFAWFIFPGMILLCAMLIMISWMLRSIYLQKTSERVKHYIKVKSDTKRGPMDSSKPRAANHSKLLPYAGHHSTLSPCATASNSTLTASLEQHTAA